MSDLQKELSKTLSDLNATLRAAIDYFGKKDEYFNNMVQATLDQIRKDEEERVKAAEDARQKEWLEIVRKSLREAYGLAFNYSKIIVGGFYAGFFAIWVGLHDILDQELMTKAGGLLILSIAVYALEIVVYSFAAKINLDKRLKYVQSQGATLEGSDTIYNEYVSLLSKFDTLNVGIFTFTLSTAIGALIFLLRAIF